MAGASQRERRRGRTAQRHDRSSRQIMTARRRDARPASRGRRASIRSSLYEYFGIVRAPQCRNSRPGAGPPWPATSRGVLPSELQKLRSIVRRSPARLAPGWGPRARRIAVPRPPPRVACRTLSTRKGCDRVCGGCRAGGRPTADRRMGWGAGHPAGGVPMWCSQNHAPTTVVDRSERTGRGERDLRARPGGRGRVGVGRGHALVRQAPWPLAFGALGAAVHPSARRPQPAHPARDPRRRDPPAPPPLTRAAPERSTYALRHTTFAHYL